MKKMTRTILTALISCTLLWTGSVCSAQVLNAEQLKELTQNQIKFDMKRYQLEEIEVIIGNLPLEKFELPEGKVSVQVISNSSTLNPKEYKKINILVNKKIQRTIYVPVEVKAYKSVVVARETISRDKAISMQSVEIKKVDVLRNIDEVLTLEDLAKGLMAKKVFFANEVITKKFTASRPDVIKDAIVAVNFKTGSELSIIVEGIAMTQGNIGDTIQVKNKRLNRIYTGRVVGENRVEIQI